MIGTKLAHFTITAHLGSGGMGDVYQATDSKLGRSVAIKFLPTAFASDPERLSRFRREAQVLASLNHPNIAHIYGLEESGETRCIVMELVEGETLQARIKRGPIPVDESLTIAKQVAEALEAAHERGVVHRDLKPGNVMITGEGNVKVLDFGLAKAHETSPSNPSLSNSPTMASMATNAGIILGTAAYMSPEQAKGRTVDKRTDIFAFGAVLIEMLTGRPAFEGGDVTEILGRVVTADPDWKGLPARTPPPIQRLLRRALRKDPRQRLGDIRDARIEIEEAGTEPKGSTVPTSARGARLVWIASLVAATVLIVALAIPAVRHLRETSPAEMRLDIATPPTTDPISLAISPDARTLVFVATAGGQSRLWLRPLESAAAQPIAGTEGATYPFWSPDSRAVGFFAENKLKRIDVRGGTVQTLANAPGGRGGSWNKDGVIVFAPVGNDSLYRVSASGGDATPVTRIDTLQNNHRMPQFLPDGHHFLFYAQGDLKGRGVYVGSLDSPDARRLFDADSAAVFLTSGYVAFLRQGTLFAQRFDVRENQPAGEPFAVAQQVAFDSVLTIAALSAAADVLVYRAGTAVGVGRLTWFDRSGKSLGTLGDPDVQGLNPQLSPDGKRVAVDRGGVSGKNDIWLLEASRGVLERFTSDTSNNIAPIWSPDGNSIVFSSNPKGIYDLYQKPVTGAGEEKLLIASGLPKWAVSWSPDGQFLLYRQQDPKTNFDLWALPLAGDHRAFPVANTGSEEREGQFSPDSRWIAFQSNESGRSEIYVEPFPGPGRRVRVSTNGGAQARWRKDGKELFYIALDGKLMAVPITLSSNGQTADVREASALFATHLTLGPLPVIQRHQYVVSPDGQRFLMNVTNQEQTATPITLILNWNSEQKK